MQLCISRTGFAFDVIAFGCTSAAMVIGPAKIQEIFETHKAQ